MRIALLLLAALPAFAQAPSEFRSSASLTLTGTDALHQLELPIEAYRDTRYGMDDVRVFNAAREPVPIAWAGAPDEVLEKAELSKLPFFPVTKLPPEGRVGEEVTVRTADGTLVSIRGKPAAKSAPKVAAFLVDASKETEAIRSLWFEWQAVPGSEVVTVRLDASDDLKSWSPIAVAPILRLQGESGALQQPRIEFAPRKSKYYRVTWDTPGFELTHVIADHEPRGKPAPRRVAKATAKLGKEGELIYEFDARLPVQAVRLVPAQENGVVVASIFSRPDPARVWRRVASASFYRMKRDGGEVQSPMLEIGNLPAQQWLVALERGSTGGPPPTLEVEWRPARLVFVAQGEGPYAIAFGNAKADSAMLPLSTLIPKYEKGAEQRLPEARVGEVRAGPPPSRFDQMVGEMKPRRVALWAILVGGVAALGFMAWRLSKQMKGRVGPPA